MSDQITKSAGRKADFDGDSWQTPQWLFDWLDDQFHFTLDAAANHMNAKCKHYFTKEDDALSRSWYGFTAFCNPPYSRGMKNKFFEHAKNECKHKSVTSVFVVPALPSEGWFPHDSAHIIWITGGRVGFVNPVTGEENPNPPSGTCAIIFSPYLVGQPATYHTVDRNEIMAKYKMQKEETTNG